MYIRYNTKNISCPFHDSEKCPINEIDYFRLPQTENNLSVTSTNIISTEDNIRENLRIPVFKGNVNPNILKNINSNIENDILEFRTEMEAAANDQAQQNKSSGKEFVPYEISNSYVVTYNKNNLLSLSLIYEQIINNKASYIRTTYNYDLNTGTSIPLKYLFKDNSNYLDALNKKIREKLQTDKNLYFPNALENFKGVAADQPYYLDDKDLVIFFRFSEIAPIASDIPVIRIPYTELRDILKPNLIK